MNFDSLEFLFFFAYNFDFLYFVKIKRKFSFFINIATYFFTHGLISFFPLINFSYIQLFLFSCFQYSSN